MHLLPHVQLQCVSAFGIAVVFAVPARSADIELPAITVQGQEPKGPEASKPPDIVMRDREERSPDVHWPTALSLRWSELFAHNVIAINASCTTVWNFIVHAESWPQWCSGIAHLKIKGNSEILEKDTKFIWDGEISDDRLDSKVVECVPENRIGWRSFGSPLDGGRPVYYTYHTFLIAPMGNQRCLVTFEEVATGPAARHARGNYPEFMHLSHQRWLEALKRVSEIHS
jgi:hypothetical protein